METGRYEALHFIPYKSDFTLVTYDLTSKMAHHKNRKMFRKKKRPAIKKFSIGSGPTHCRGFTITLRNTTLSSSPPDE